MKAIILAGGYATRLRPLSCSNPKLLFPIVGVPLIDHMVNWLGEAGVDDIILAVNHLSDRLRTEIGPERLGSRITFSIEENPLGTAGPIRLAKDQLDDEPFVVVNGDIVSDFDLKHMIKSHESSSAKATIGLTTVRDPRPYGTVDTNNSGMITKFEEKSKVRKRHEINAGVYILDPSVIQLIPPAIACSMERMIFPKLVEENQIWGWKHAGYWYDIGTIPEYLRANKELLKHYRPKRTLKTAHEEATTTVQREAAGQMSGSQLLERRSAHAETNPSATIKEPCYVGEGSVLHRGASLGPGAILSRGVAVDGGTRVRDSIIFEYTSLGRNCVVEGAIIGERVSIGAGTRIGRGAIIAGEVNVPSHSLIKQKAVILN